MYEYIDQIRARRKTLGLTQSELSHLAHISLPTLHNIEAGKANPGWDVIAKILEVLGLEIQLVSQKADWDFLTHTAGVPLQLTRSIKRNPSMHVPVLLRELFLAAKELQPLLPENARRAEALRAFLFALKTHYPTFFRKNISRIPELSGLVSKAVDGKTIKLSRIALERISKYL